MIIGTAGHIDHGKTTLVRAPDRHRTPTGSNKSKAAASPSSWATPTCRCPMAQVLGIIRRARPREIRPHHGRRRRGHRPRPAGRGRRRWRHAANAGARCKSCNCWASAAPAWPSPRPTACRRSGCTQVQEEVAAILSVTAMADAPLFATAASPAGRPRHLGLAPAFAGTGATPCGPQQHGAVSPGGGPCLQPRPGKAPSSPAPSLAARSAWATA